MGWTGFSKKFIKAHPELFEYVESQTDKDASGMQGTFRSFQLLKPICLTPEFCVTPTNKVMEHAIDLVSQGVEPLDVILGTDVIRQFKWYFDFKNQRFAVQPR